MWGVYSLLWYTEYIYIYIYISNIQSVSEDDGCGLFAFRIYEEFYINLW